MKKKTAFGEVSAPCAAGTSLALARIAGRTSTCGFGEDAGCAWAGTAVYGRLGDVAEGFTEPKHVGECDGDLFNSSLLHFPGQRPISACNGFTLASLRRTAVARARSILPPKGRLVRALCTRAFCGEMT